jgi:hypothetical protein
VLPDVLAQQLRTEREIGLNVFGLGRRIQEMVFEHWAEFIASAAKEPVSQRRIQNSEVRNQNSERGTEGNHAYGATNVPRFFSEF